MWPAASGSCNQRVTVLIPEDFMFELSGEEFKNWRSQFVTSNGAAIRPTVPGGFRCFKMSGLAYNPRHFV